MRADRTIAVTEETKKKLRRLKKYERETFDDIINRLLGQCSIVIDTKNGTRTINIEDLGTMLRKNKNFEDLGEMLWNKIKQTKQEELISPTPFFISEGEKKKKKTKKD